MNNKESKIFLIDDDEEICLSISLLLMSAGYKIETFNSTEKLLGN